MTVRLCAGVDGEVLQFVTKQELMEDLGLTQEQVYSLSPCVIDARYGYIPSPLVRLVPDAHLADGKERVPLRDGTHPWAVRNVRRAGESTPAPGESTPAPGESIPAPGESAPAPGESTPAPGESTPAPGESTPAPGESAPAPGESAPKEVCIRGHRGGVRKGVMDSYGGVDWDSRGGNNSRWGVDVTLMSHRCHTNNVTLIMSH